MIWIFLVCWRYHDFNQRINAQAQLLSILHHSTGNQKTLYMERFIIFQTYASHTFQLCDSYMHIKPYFISSLKIELLFIMAQQVVLSVHMQQNSRWVIYVSGADSSAPKIFCGTSGLRATQKLLLVNNRCAKTTGHMRIRSCRCLTFLFFSLL